MTTRQNRLQNKLRRILNLDELTFVLGDGSGRVFAGNGRVFVRQRIGLDVSGAPSFSTAITAKHQAGATYPVYGGSPVKLAYDKAGDLQVVGSDFQAIVATGVDPALLNAGNPYTRQERILNYAKPHVEPDTNKLGATQLLYRKPDGSVAFFDPSLATFIDPSGDLPASGKHRLLGMYIDVTSNALGRTLGTAKAQSQAFAVGDVNEVVTAMPADAIPLAAWVLRAGQTVWRNSDVFIDLRQFINTASGGGTEFDATTILTDTDGSVVSDSEGNVMLVEVA